MLLTPDLTEQVIGLAIEVHRITGPGMLEPVHEDGLCHELEQAGVAFERRTGIPVKGIHLDQGLRADIIVDCQVIIEIKAVAKLMPAHDAQRLSYLRMSGLR